jgi:exodeoxyribonuclease VIII
MYEGQLMVMLDLETMSTASNACICSIGAAKFTVERGVLDTFYTTVDAKDCKRLGLDFSKDTLEWWKKQNPEALKALIKKTVPLEEAVTEFSKWFGTKSLKTWGKGSAFDLVILRSAYKAVNIQQPWKYTHELCFRTLVDLFPEVREPKREGTYHNALDDAMHQVKHFIKIVADPDQAITVDNSDNIDSDQEEITCPICHGRMWDNRVTKRNPRAPDYKCRDKSCEGVIWPPRL